MFVAVLNINCFREANMMSEFRRMFFASAVAAFVLTTNGVTFAQKVSGAIFTTDQNSTFVNGNVYNAGQEVYLNGGPRPNAPCTAAGLPWGDYYFQVTDPSGKELLSSDPIEYRRITVSGGLITGATIFHYTGVGKCADLNTDNITVQLWPFDPTPNPGGEYKVWITKFDDYDITLSGSFGFIPSKSKTDNFKVVDYDGDDLPDSEDPCPSDPFNNCGEQPDPV
jgi:hypothetical protein